MNRNGSITAETAVVFPLFLMLLIVLIFVLINFITYEFEETDEEYEFIRNIYLVDSMKRKAEIIDGLFE